MLGKKEGVVKMLRLDGADLQTRGTQRAVIRPYGCMVLVIIVSCDVGTNAMLYEP